MPTPHSTASVTTSEPVHRTVESGADGGQRHGRRGPLVLSAALLAVAALLMTGCIGLNENQDKNLRWVNQSRAQYGRSALPIYADAQAKAQAWADRLARENRLYHSTLSAGITTRWCGLAENVGEGSYTSQVHEAFMRSPQHRANILDRAWTGMGVGVARRGNTAWVVHVFVQAC